MKTLILSLTFCITTTFVCAQTGSITGIQVSQRTDGSMLVDIYYDLTGSADMYNISIEASFDGGSTFEPIPPEYLQGAVSGVSPGNGKHIVWDGLGSFPNQYSDNSQLRFTATLFITNFFDIGELINYLPGNETYGFNAQSLFPTPDNKLFVSYAEKNVYPIRYRRYLFLNNDLTLLFGPNDIINNDQRTQYESFAYKDGHLYFACLHVTPGRDPLKFGKISFANYATHYIGSKSWWPTGAFSDNHIRKLFKSSNGDFYIINAWRYNGWSVERERLYISKSSNNMVSWSNWIYGGSAFGEGLMYCNTALEFDNEILLCLQTTWGGTDKIVFVKFNMTTNTFSNFIHVATGIGASMFVQDNTLAIAYVNSNGEGVVKYAHTNNTSSWSDEVTLHNSTNDLIHLFGNSNINGVFDQERKLLLATKSDTQFILEWDGNTSWQKIGISPNTSDGLDYHGGKISLGSNNIIYVIKGYVDENNKRYTHISTF